ncbi:MAG TPA: DUF3500 domain-containing protein [Tepidisphaeraceae bacterium]|nr:DUF3500 domain-containing protein [Tepidisphaeraceae bacterium]
MPLPTLRRSALLVALAFAAPAYADTPAPSAQLAKLSTEMADAANKLLASLTPEQKAAASFPFGPTDLKEAVAAKDNERLNWHFVPKPRKGLTLKSMTPEQRDLAKAMVKTGLSDSGTDKLYAIMSLEDVLKAIEPGPPKSPARDSEMYFWSLFGKPGDPKEAWGWRVEGHHFCANFTVVHGKGAAGGPAFFGTNPGEVRDGPKKGLRVLAEEEDLGRALVKSLTPDQQKKAIISATAYKDILTMADREAKLKAGFEGIPFGELTDGQKSAVTKLIDVYTARFRPELAADDVARMRAAGLEKIHFAWAGELEPGKGHYYRVHGPTFLIEYDNTQNNANHVHSVYRDLQNDWGGDLLKKHYEQSHGAK